MTNTTNFLKINYGTHFFLNKWKCNHLSFFKKQVFCEVNLQENYCNESLIYMYNNSLKFYLTYTKFFMEKNTQKYDYQSIKSQEWRKIKISHPPTRSRDMLAVRGNRERHFKENSFCKVHLHGGLMKDVGYGWNGRWMKQTR